MTTIQKMMIGLPMVVAVTFCAAMFLTMLWALIMYRRGRHDLYRASDNYVFSLYVGCAVSCLVSVAGAIVTL